MRFPRGPNSNVGQDAFQHVATTGLEDKINIAHGGRRGIQARLNINTNNTANGMYCRLKSSTLGRPKELTRVW